MPDLAQDFIELKLISAQGTALMIILSEKLRNTEMIANCSTAE